MATGYEHYRQAEVATAIAVAMDEQRLIGWERRVELAMAKAQVHATLAMAAAQVEVALSMQADNGVSTEWIRAVTL